MVRSSPATRRHVLSTLCTTVVFGMRYKAQWPKPSPTPHRHTVGPPQCPGGWIQTHSRSFASAVRLQAREQEAQKSRPGHSLALRLPPCSCFREARPSGPAVQAGGHLQSHILCLGSPVHSRSTAGHLTPHWLGCDTETRQGWGAAGGKGHHEGSSSGVLRLHLPVLLPTQRWPMEDSELGPAHEPEGQKRVSETSAQLEPCLVYQDIYTAGHSGYFLGRLRCYKHTFQVS